MPSKTPTFIRELVLFYQEQVVEVEEILHTKANYPVEDQFDFIQQASEESMAQRLLGMIMMIEHQMLKRHCFQGYQNVAVTSGADPIDFADRLIVRPNDVEYKEWRRRYQCTL